MKKERFTPSLRRVRGIFLFGVIILMCLLNASLAMAQDIPEFKITWKSWSTFGILFTSKLSDKEIERVIYAFRELKNRGELSKYFSPTTPGMKNKHAAIQIQIFTNPKWASEKMMKDFVDNKLSKKTEQEYINNIRGCYGWQDLNTRFEMGSIGDKEGKIQSKNYKLLFKSE